MGMFTRQASMIRGEYIVHIEDELECSQAILTNAEYEEITETKIKSY